MKFLFVMILASTSAFAQGDLLNCTKTSFTDLARVEISSTNKTGEIVITEIADNGSVNTYVREAVSSKNNEFELSSWYGYTRTLYFDGNGWSIEHRDECGGGYSTAICE